MCSTTENKFGSTGNKFVSIVKTCSSAGIMFGSASLICVIQPKTRSSRPQICAAPSKQVRLVRKHEQLSRNLVRFIRKRVKQTSHLMFGKPNINWSPATYMSESTSQTAQTDHTNQITKYSFSSTIKTNRKGGEPFRLLNPHTNPVRPPKCLIHKSL